MLDITEVEVAPDKARVFECLMSQPGEPIYVLGRNRYAQRVSRLLPIDGFIDDFTKESSYLGRPVLRMAGIPSRSIVISCVVDGWPLTALDRLRSAGLHQVIDYFTLVRLAPDRFAPVDYCVNNRQQILGNLSRCERVHGRLADALSRDHYAKVLRFRLSMDLDHMRGLSCRLEDQYFEDFLPFRPGDVFVDGGGYDGETTLQYAMRNQAYRRIYFFEPVPAMMSVSEGKLAALRDVCFVRKGLFSRNCRLRFDADAGPASRISTDGQTEIEVSRLDDEVKERIATLKLDIEGAEYEALEGARGHIRSESPALAICIYHQPQDFWRIPEKVLELNDCYDIYLRHYTEGVLETVMFFIPSASADGKPRRPLLS